MKKLGIIGGMGPMATIVFMQKLISMTDAASDQEHIEMVVEHCPDIPDRTGYILDHTKPDPLPYMAAAADRLEKSGADLIAIPCVTAHYFHGELTKKAGIPVVNGVAETAEYLKKRGIRTVGIMATDGTVKSGLFQRELEKCGITPVYPEAPGQKLVMDLIYEDVKAGRPVEKEKFKAVARELMGKGAEVIILGCTELSVIAQEWLPEKGVYLDVLDVLSRACVERFGKLKSEYLELL